MNKKQKLKEAIWKMGYKSQKDFCQAYGIDGAYLSRKLNSGEPLPARLQNILQAHEDTKGAIMELLG